MKNPTRCPRGFGAQGEGKGVKVTPFLGHLEMMLHPPAALLPMLGQLDTGPDLP